MPIKEGYKLIELKHGEQLVGTMLQIGEGIYKGEDVTPLEPTPLKKRFGIWF